MGDLTTDLWGTGHLGASLKSKGHRQCRSLNPTLFKGVIVFLIQQVLRESEGRRWVDEAAQKTIWVTEGRDCPVPNQYLYLVEFIHFCSLCKPWAGFPLHSELVQLFSVRNRAPSHCILTPLPFHL